MVEYIIKDSNANPYTFCYDNGGRAQRAMLLMPSGRVYLIYQDYSTGAIRSYYSDDNGVTTPWDSEQIIAAPTTPSNPSKWNIFITLAASGNPLVAVKMEYSVGNRWRFFERIAGTWTEKAGTITPSTSSNVTSGVQPFLFQHPSNANYWILITADQAGTAGRERCIYYRSTDGMATWDALGIVHAVANGNQSSICQPRSGFGAAMNASGEISVIHHIVPGFNNDGMGWTKITDWNSTTVVTAQTDILTGLSTDTICCPDVIYESGGVNLQVVYTLVNNGHLYYKKWNGSVWSAAEDIHGCRAGSPRLYLDADKPWTVYVGQCGTNGTNYHPWTMSKVSGSWVNAQLTTQAKDEFDLMSIKGAAGYMYARHYSSFPATSHHYSVTSSDWDSGASTFSPKQASMNIGGW